MAAANEYSHLTFLTVVYELEKSLLQLQARSASFHLREAHGPAQFLVVDNCRRPMSAGERTELLSAYGPHAPRVRILRASDIAAIPRTLGYRSQQVLKLAAATQVSTPRYVVLDAKNHFISPPDRRWFEGSDGRIRALVLDYRGHLNQSDLERVLRYCELDPKDHVGRFTAMVTPFTIDSAVARTLTAEIGDRVGGDFAKEFLDRGLLEFFLYTAWQLARGDSLDVLYEAHTAPWPMLWNHNANRAGLGEAILQASEGAPLFAVHRAALAAMDGEAAALLSRFWVERSLFGSEAAALEFIAAFRRQHRRGVIAKRLREAPTAARAKIRVRSRHT